MIVIDGTFLALGFFGFIIFSKFGMGALIWPAVGFFTCWGMCRLYKWLDKMTQLYYKQIITIAVVSSTAYCTIGWQGILTVVMIAGMIGTILFGLWCTYQCFVGIVSEIKKRPIVTSLYTIFLVVPFIFIVTMSSMPIHH